MIQHRKCRQNKKIYILIFIIYILYIYFFITDTKIITKTGHLADRVDGYGIAKQRMRYTLEVLYVQNNDYVRAVQISLYSSEQGPEFDL